MIIYSKPLIGPNFYIASVEDLIGNFDSPEPGSVLIIIKEKDGCKLCQGAIIAGGITSFNNLYNDFLKSKLKKEKKENESMNIGFMDKPNNDNIAIKSNLDEFHETITQEIDSKIESALEENDSKIDEVTKLVNDKFDKTIDHFNLIESDLFSVYSEDRKEMRKRFDSIDDQLHKLQIINIISNIAVIISSISVIIMSIRVVI